MAEWLQEVGWNSTQRGRQSRGALDDDVHDGLVLTTAIGCDETPRSQERRNATNGIAGLQCYAD